MENAERNDIKFKDTTETRYDENKKQPGFLLTSRHIYYTQYMCVCLWISFAIVTKCARSAWRYTYATLLFRIGWMGYWILPKNIENENAEQEG